MMPTIRPKHPPTPLRAAVLALVLLFATAAVAAAQLPPKTPPTGGGGKSSSGEPSSSAYSPRGGRFLVGDEAPDINLRDEDGKQYKLADERKHRSQLVIFVRRTEDMVEIDKSIAPLAELGLAPVAVTRFHRDRVEKIGMKPKVRMCYDGASVTARAYGVYDPVSSTPRDGAFLVDRKGRILLIISGGIPSSSELVRMAREALEDAGERPAAEAAAIEG